MGADTLSSGKKGYQKTFTQRKRFMYRFFRQCSLLRLRCRGIYRPQRETWLEL